MKMSSIIDFLKKIGLLHTGGKTYAGKNTGGDFATADYQSSSKKKTKKKRKLLAKEPSKSWGSNILLVLGVVLILWGLLLLLAAPLSGVAAIFAGVLLVPSTFAWIVDHWSLAKKDGIRVFLVIALLIVMFLAAGV